MLLIKSPPGTNLLKSGDGPQVLGNKTRTFKAQTHSCMIPIQDITELMGTMILERINAILLDAATMKTGLMDMGDGELPSSAGRMDIISIHTKTVLVHAITLKRIV